MTLRRGRKPTVARLGLLLGVLSAGTACRSIEPGPEAPGSEAIHTAPSSSPDAQAGAETAADVLRWGGWHDVPCDPSAGAALRRAHAFAQAGRREDALEELNLALARHPGVSALHEARGVLYASLSYRRAAQRDLEAAVRFAPHRGAAWFALGRVRHELGLPRAALTAFETSHERGHAGPQLDLFTARALRRLGHRGQAAARYARALREGLEDDVLVLLEAASLCVAPAPVPDAAWEEARRRHVGPADEVEAERVRALLLDYGGGDLAHLRRAYEATGLDPDALARWARTALVAVALDDPRRDAGPDLALAPAQ